MTRNSLIAAGLLLGLAAPAAWAQGEDPNFANPNVLVTVQRDGYTISGLVTHLKDVKSFRYGVALFPGYPGMMKLREEGGQLRFELRANYLLRSRRFWLDEETLAVAVDAPSDQWATFYQHFRSGPRYGADVGALLKEVVDRFPVKEWAFVGTSEGSISAAYAARANPQLAPRVILTGSLILSGPNGAGLTSFDWNSIAPGKLLWVHHAEDPCRFTPYGEARRYAERTKSPLVTVRGGSEPRSDPCEAMSKHGFIGMERAAVLAMRSWVKTGAVPPDVGP